jgi:hypothetical protein
MVGAISLLRSQDQPEAYPFVDRGVNLDTGREPIEERSLPVFTDRRLAESPFLVLP